MQFQRCRITDLRSTDKPQNHCRGSCPLYAVDFTDLQIELLAVKADQTNRGAADSQPPFSRIGFLSGPPLYARGLNTGEAYGGRREGPDVFTEESVPTVWYGHGGGAHDWTYYTDPNRHIHCDFPGRFLAVSFAVQYLFHRPPGSPNRVYRT